MLNFGRKRPRPEQSAEDAQGKTVTDLSGRASLQFVRAALASIEELALAHGAVAHPHLLLDAQGRHALTTELVRCYGRAIVERQTAPTGAVTLSDVFDVGELAVRILVLLPPTNRNSCASVCKAWSARVREDCEHEDLHDSKTIRCTLLHRMDSPVTQLGLFSRSSKAFVLALSKRCELKKILCDDAGNAVQTNAWTVPGAAPDAEWSRFWEFPTLQEPVGAPAHQAVGSGEGLDLSEIPEQSPVDQSDLAGGASGYAEAGPSDLLNAGGDLIGAGEIGAAGESQPALVAAVSRQPQDAQVVINNAGSYFMLLQQGKVRLFYALFHREWSPEQIALSFTLPKHVTALQFFPLDNNVFAVAHAALGDEPGDPPVYTIQVFTVRGATIQTLRGFHARPIESIWYYKGTHGSFAFQVTQSADIIHWWRLSHNPQWPGMVHQAPTRSLALSTDGGPTIAVRLHPAGDAVMIACPRELRMRSFCETIPNARRKLRVLTAATLLSLEGLVLVAGSISSDRSDQILFFSCSGLNLLRKCSLMQGCGLFSRITVIIPPEVPETRTQKKRQNSIHELAVGNDRGEVILFRYK